MDMEVQIKKKEKFNPFKVRIEDVVEVLSNTHHQGLINLKFNVIIIRDLVILQVNVERNKRRLKRMVLITQMYLITIQEVYLFNL